MDHDLLTKAIADAVQRAVASEVEAAAAEVQRRLRERVKEIAISVLGNFDVERSANRIIITVKMGPDR